MNPYELPPRILNKIADEVESAVGSGSGAWDMVNRTQLIQAVVNAYHAYLASCDQQQTKVGNQ